MQLAKVVIASALVLAIYAQGLPEGKKKFSVDKGFKSEFAVSNEL